jgi:hypothetical protein
MPVSLVIKSGAAFEVTTFATRFTFEFSLAAHGRLVPKAPYG